MSCARCTGCGRIVDTDYDCEFYYVDDKVTLGLCEKCREEVYSLRTIE